MSKSGMTSNVFIKPSAVAGAKQLRGKLTNELNESDLEKVNGGSWARPSIEQLANVKVPGIKKPEK
jgi:hypothetical protein